MQNYKTLPLKIKNASLTITVAILLGLLSIGTIYFVHQRESLITSIENQKQKSVLALQALVEINQERADSISKLPLFLKDLSLQKSLSELKAFNMRTTEEYSQWEFQLNAINSQIATELIQALQAPKNEGKLVHQQIQKIEKLDERLEQHRRDYEITLQKLNPQILKFNKSYSIPFFDKTPLKTPVLSPLYAKVSP